ncbi:MAG: 30S ribosomal protein S12, partial [Candidatus Omnitrophota bacterium]
MPTITQLLRKPRIRKRRRTKSP